MFSFRFKSSDFASGRGFRLDYHSSIVATPFTLGNLRLGACGGNFTTPRGLLTSPSYPNKYPTNADCVYFISQKNATLITLIFHEIDIKVDNTISDCMYWGHYLEIRGDGINNASTFICGHHAAPIPITGSTLWLR